MKICVFSDIHGNNHAFKQALPMLKNEGADLYLFLGDLCGYYFDQEEIFAELINLPNLLSLLGNHDQMFLEILHGDEILRRNYLEKYGKSMEYLLEKDYKEMNNWLSELPGPSIKVIKGVTAFHGSPQDPMEGYVYPDTSLDLFLEESSNFFLLGHTHYPMNRRIGEKWIVNPGSLGQPRNGSCPTYAVIDSSLWSVTFRQVPYYRDDLARQIEKMDGNHPYLKTVLFR